MWNDSQINKYTYNLSCRYRNKCVSLQSQIKIMSEIEQLVRGGLYEKYEWAFWGCKHLRRLLIPEWVTCIEGGIVTAHEGFEGVECHAKGFHVENDALIDDERQELLCCWTQQKNYVVPGCVKRIADISGNDFVETIIVKLLKQANWGLLISSSQMLLIARWSYRSYFSNILELPKTKK